MLKIPGFRVSPAGHTGTTLIAAGATIEGSIRFAGTLEIEGCVVGDIRADADEQAVVRILPGAQVRGNVHAPVIVVNGTVTGNVHSSEHVELASQAIVHGGVEYRLVEMTKGAQLNGRLCYRGDAGPANASFEPVVDPGSHPEQ